MWYFKTWKEIIRKPPEFYQKMPKDGGYADPIIFSTISFAFYGILSVLFNPNMFPEYEFNPFMVPTFLILTPVVGIISLFIESSILYAMFRSLGGSGSYEGTLRIAAYATAVLLFAWIPYIGLVFGLYMVFLHIMGGTFVHNIVVGRSLFLLLFPLIMIFMIVMPLAITYVSFVTFI